MPYDTLPTPETLNKTIESVKARGIDVVVVDTRAEALDKVKTLIPAGAGVMAGTSTTLIQIGLDDVLNNPDCPWRNMKAEIQAEPDSAKRGLLRRQSTLTDYYLGSVHAITENGVLLFVSATGSQLPAYAYSSSNIIFVAGAQKIVTDLEQGFKRVHDYVVPLEDRRNKDTGGSGAVIGKWLIFEREFPSLKRKVTLILVNEVLGF